MVILMTTMITNIWFTTDHDDDDYDNNEKDDDYDNNDNVDDRYDDNDIRFDNRPD